MIQIDPRILAELVRRLGGRVEIDMHHLEGECADIVQQIDQPTRSVVIRIIERPIDAPFALVEERILLEDRR